MSTKYFRTPHLPYSPGGTNDDKRLHTDSGFANREVVITEKMIVVELDDGTTEVYVCARIGFEQVDHEPQTGSWLAEVMG